MKKILFFVLTTLSMAIFPLTLNVKIEIRTKENGELYVYLYNSQKGFDGKGQYIQDKTIPSSEVKEGNYVTVSFEGLEPGKYAVKAYVDSNKNHEHDLRVVNPEPWGVSNAVRPGARHPKWNEAVMDLANDTSIDFFVKEGLSKK